MLYGKKGRKSRGHSRELNLKANTANPPASAVSSSSIRQMTTFFRDNWAWLAPGAYIYLSLVGMMQSWMQFRRYGLNIFDIAEISDFLLAAVREPFSLFALVCTLAYFGLLTWIASDSRSRGKPIENGSVAHVLQIFYALLLGLIFVGLPIGIPAFVETGFTVLRLHDPMRVINVSVKDLVGVTVGKDGWIRGAHLIGTTSKYFVLQTADKELLVLPISNVTAFSIPARQSISSIRVVGQPGHSMVELACIPASDPVINFLDNSMWPIG